MKSPLGFRSTRIDTLYILAFAAVADVLNNTLHITI